MCDDEIERAARYLVQSAIQPEPARASVAFNVAKRNGGYEILRNGEPMDVQFDPLQVLYALYRRIERDALEAWPETTVLHALTGSHRGEHFLLVGESHADRARVGLELLRLGADVLGDDLAILDGGMVIAYPRPLRVVGEEASLPAGAPPRDELPFAGTNRASGSWALDLAAAGVDWRITPARPESVIVLETNPGGQSRVRAIARRDMARIVIGRSESRGSPMTTIRAVANLVDGARCYALRLGDPAALRFFLPGGMG